MCIYDIILMFFCRYNFPKWMNEMGKYDEIINLPHHQSSTRPHISMHKRAAQFAPFAALSGHSDMIQEEKELTEQRVAQEEAGEKILDDYIYYEDWET